MIHWDKPFEKVLDNSNPPFTKWFSGGYLNACYNCVDRHVLAGNGSKVAIIHDSPLTNTIRKVTYQEIYDTVKLFNNLKIEEEIKSKNKIWIFFINRAHVLLVDFKNLVLKKVTILQVFFYG